MKQLQSIKPFFVEHCALAHCLIILTQFIACVVIMKILGYSVTGLEGFGELIISGGLGLGLGLGLAFLFISLETYDFMSDRLSGRTKVKP